MMAVSSFGIMPPLATPDAIRPRASATLIWRIRFLSASSTPAMSVSSSMRLALSLPATAPATVSALML